MGRLLALGVFNRDCKPSNVVVDGAKVGFSEIWKRFPRFILGFIGEFLPDLGEGTLFEILTLGYKTATLGFCFIGVIYFLKVSEDMNNIIEKGIQKEDIEVGWIPDYLRELEILS